VARQDIADAADQEVTDPASNRVLFSIDGRIATLTINRPEKLNALDPGMLEAMAGHLRGLDRSTEARVLIVSATGDRAFCVGADVGVWSSLEPIEMWRDWVRTGSAVFDQLARLRIPTIAALNGYTFGGGLELALACDLRIAADTVQLSAPETKIATVPGWGGTYRLAELIGPARAKQMIFTGARITAETAATWGLVNEVVAGDQVPSRVREVASEIAANAPVSVQLAKAAIDGARGIGSGVTFEAMAGALAAMTEDGREGVQAFREKRTPEFKDQ
jgi:enoyl-CoA hydratase/carnithine racemase